MPVHRRNPLDGPLGRVVSLEEFPFEITPFWWFLLIVAGMGQIMIGKGRLPGGWKGLAVGFLLLLIPITGSQFSGTKETGIGPQRFYWSPYYLLFIREAFADVRRLLKPDGLFAVYNFFRQGWIVARIARTMIETFGATPLVMPFPWEDTIRPSSQNGYTIIMAGKTEAMAAAFARNPVCSVPLTYPPSPGSDNGFLAGPDATGTARLRLSAVETPPDLITPTDDWPFLYLRNPMLPDLSLHGILIMAGIAFAQIAFSLPRDRAASPAIPSLWRMFFLGAGFMLIETKGVVQMSLLFGSTWTVNSLVFLAVLTMVMGANLFVLRFQPTRQGPFYLLLFLALGANFLIPLNSFLGWPELARTLGACLLVFTPIFLAGIIFSTSFQASRDPDLDLGFNIAGSMAGGLLENASMLVGFRLLVGVAGLAYLLSAIGLWFPAAGGGGAATTPVERGREESRSESRPTPEAP